MSVEWLVWCLNGFGRFTHAAHRYLVVQFAYLSQSYLHGIAALLRALGWMRIDTCSLPVAEKMREYAKSIDSSEVEEAVFDFEFDIDVENVAREDEFGGERLYGLAELGRMRRMKYALRRSIEDLGRGIERKGYIDVKETLYFSVQYFWRLRKYLEAGWLSEEDLIGQARRCGCVGLVRELIKGWDEFIEHLKRMGLGEGMAERFRLMP